MNKEDIQKLIGGYATGTLTDEERKALFEAAIEDQDLFDSLQDEQALKELFDDPFSREQVRSAAAESLPQSQKTSRISWFRRPWIWASAASVALAGILVVALVRWDRMQPQPEQQKQVVASGRQPAAPVVEEKSPPAPPPEPEKPLAGKPPAAKSPEVRNPRARIAQESPRREATKATLSAGAPRGIGRSSSSGYRASVSNPEPNDSKLEHRAENSEYARNAPSDPSNSNSTLRDIEKNRSDQPVKKEEDKDRNEVALSLPRRAPAPAPPQQPAPQVQQAEKQQGQLDRPAQQSVPLQSQSVVVQSSPSAGAPQQQRSQGTLEQPPRAPASKTESSDELLKDQRKSKSSSGAGFGAARVIAGGLKAPYSLARQLNDGSFATVPSATAFKPGEVLRLTINPGNSGPVQILEWDENDPQWRKVYPPADDLDTAAKTASATFVVQKSLRVRVTIGSTTTDIPIRIVEAAK